jgi:hypothetical protein
MKDLQRARQDSKKSKRRISDPNSIKKALKFSKRLLAKKGIIVESNWRKAKK